MQHPRSRRSDLGKAGAFAKGHLGRIASAVITTCLLWQPVSAIAEQKAAETPAIEPQATYYDGYTYYDDYGYSYYDDYGYYDGYSYSYNPYNYNYSYSYTTTRSNSSERDVSRATIKLSTTTYTYTGTEIKPTIEVYFPNYYYNNGTTYYDFTDWTRYNDYYWWYDNGSWYIDIDDDGYHNDSYVIYYDDYNGGYYYQLDGVRYTVSIPNYTRNNSYNYNSSYSDLYLHEGTDYYVTYSNNVNPGTATITIHGKSPYYGSKSIDFTISGSSMDSMAIRLSGANRYDTMSAIVNEGFNSKSSVAVVACGNNFPDALAASSLAGGHGAPVILTDTNALTPQAANQLSRLSVTTVYLMGGTAALSPAVESAITNMGITVHRVAGADRIATSLQAYTETRNVNPNNISNTVIIATGYNFADSLSIGPWAYAFRTPIILAQSDGTLSQEAVNTIKGDPTKSNIILVGGTAVVSDAVKDQLGDIYHYTRLSGTNRYETSRAIADWEINNGFNWQRPILATGNNFPDALAGAALGGSTRSVMLLVSSASDATVSTMTANKQSISKFYVVGGEQAISNSLVNAIASAVK